MNPRRNSLRILRRTLPRNPAWGKAPWNPSRNSLWPGEVLQGITQRILLKIPEGSFLEAWIRSPRNPCRNTQRRNSFLEEFLEKFVNVLLNICKISPRKPWRHELLKEFVKKSLEESHIDILDDLPKESLKEFPRSHSTTVRRNPWSDSRRNLWRNSLRNSLTVTYSKKSLIELPKKLLKEFFR